RLGQVTLLLGEVAGPVSEVLVLLGLGLVDRGLQFRALLRKPLQFVLELLLLAGHFLGLVRVLLLGQLLGQLFLPLRELLQFHLVHALLGEAVVFLLEFFEALDRVLEFAVGGFQVLVARLGSGLFALGLLDRRRRVVHLLVADFLKPVGQRRH